MLTRDPLPLSDSDLPQPGWRRALTERLHDITASFRGLRRGALQVQLPQNDRTMNLALAALLAIMLYVGALTLLAHHVLSHAAHGLDPVMQSRVTVEILPDSAKPDDRKSVDARAAAALGVLRKQPQVQSATIMDAPHMAKLLEPWLGDAAKLDQLPLPVLIDVQLNDDAPAAHAAVKDALKDISGAAYDDHARFQNELAQFVNALRGVDVAVLGFSLAALLLTSYFAAQATFHMNREVIELLHLIGADDQAVAQHMGLAVVRQALFAACVAMGFAFLTLIAVWLNSRALDLSFFPSLTISAADWLGLVVAWLVMMIVAVLACLLAVRFSVLRALRRLF